MIIMSEVETVKTELSKVGVSINDIYDLVNTKEPYPRAIPVLLNLLKKGIEHIGIKEGIIRALAVKEAVGIANPVLFEEYNKTPKDKMLLKWAIGNTIYTTITENYIEKAVAIVKDKSNGMSRQMFVLALGKIKSTDIENVLIELLDDNEVCPHALDALGRLKSTRAKEKITHLLNHPNNLIRKEALKALKKIK